MTIVEFIAARLADKHSAARLYASASAESSPLLVREGQRALREAEAMRRILVFVGSIPQPEVTDPVLRWMAEVWSDHSDYQQDWKS